MDKFLTFPGLQPIYLGDINFLQESVSDAFLLLLKGLTGQDSPRCVLKEATVQSDGAICFDGEILPSKYGPVTDRSVYKIVSAFSGQRVFKNQDTHDCYETRYVIVSEGVTTSLDNVANFPTLQSLISGNAATQDTYEFTYSSEDFESNIKITNTGRVYYVTGAFKQLRPVSGVLANFRLNLPYGSNLFFTATAKTSNNEIVNIPLTLTENLQTEGIAVSKYNQISLSAKQLLDGNEKYSEGYFNLVIQ